MSEYVEDVEEGEGEEVFLWRDIIITRYYLDGSITKGTPSTKLVNTIRQSDYIKNQYSMNWKKREPDPPPSHTIGLDRYM